MSCVNALEYDFCEDETKSHGIREGRLVPRILIVDDQEEIRQMVASMLQDEFEIVGLAGNGKQALEFVVDRSPDLLVLDVFMPVLNGIETAACLQASRCRARILFVTVHEDPDFLSAAMSVGARGYVSKAHLATDLIPAIRSVMEGRIYVSSCINLS